MDGKNLRQFKEDKKATTIVTRHSFSTIMKNSGASTEFIQEALGHTNKRTTENYLDSFEKEIKKEFSAKLSAFKKEGACQVGNSFWKSNCQSAIMLLQIISRS